MNLESSSHDNVQLSSYTTTYDEDLGGEYITSTPTLTNIIGHIEEYYQTQESDVDSVRERDKAVRFRLIIKATAAIETALSLGAYLRVTKRKHPDTFNWVAQSGTEQYIVRYINRVYANGRVLSIGLERKDVSA